jgi:hypothetical protein
MKPDRIQRFYGLALRLYPRRFRVANGSAMFQAFSDARADASLPPAALARTILIDLAISLAKEHLAMFREAFGRPALLFNAVVLAGISTILALALYAIPQQVLRQGLNDPQIEIATNLATVLDQYGVNDGLIQGALPSFGLGGRVEMARSLSPFVIVYNDAGQPLGWSGLLDGKPPVPSAGVFNYVRAHGEDRITWQPRHDVRIAAVVERVAGAQPGFVLAGRNMREVQSRIGQVSQMASLAWICMLALILFGTAAFGWFSRPKTT